MNFKRVASGICALAMVGSTAAAPAQTIIPALQTAIVASAANEKTYGNLLYKSDGKQITITGALNKDSLTSVVIPSKIEGLPVTTMKNDVFTDFKELRSVTIQPGLQRIEGDRLWDGCFSNCVKLKTLSLPNTLLEIGSFAFADCDSLEAINIPDSVDTVRYGAFLGCNSAKTIKLSSNLTTIEDETFRACDSVTSVVIPSKVKTICDSAFKNCTSLTSVTLPEGLETIKSYAFSNCTKLMNVNIPYSVTTIDYHALGYDSEGDKYAISFGVYKGTEGERYARDNGFNYTYINTSLAKATVTTVSSSVYTGNVITPGITVTLNGKSLINGVDYTASYSNNVNCGKATVTIIGKDRYVGTAKTTFVIRPAKMVSKKLVSTKSRTLKMRWVKAKGGVTGYQMVVSTDRKFKKNKKAVIIKRPAATAKTIKGLKKGKVYYAKIRAFKKVDGKNYFGAWSKLKKVKVK